MWVTIYSIQCTVPFKFVYYKDSQAHQHNWHEHDDCSAAVATITTVHKWGFEGERENGQMLNIGFTTLLNNNIFCLFHSLVYFTRIIFSLAAYEG